MTRVIDLVGSNPSHHIALRGVRVSSRLAGMTGRTVVEQLFVNAEDAAVEAVYTFPLPDEAAVCHFEIVLGDRVLTGKVEERENAIKQYEDAMNQGDGAFLMEKERGDIFTVRVGNLLPRQAVRVRLAYVQALDVADGTIRFVLPTTVAPRYVTATASDPVQMAIDADAINPPHVLAVPYGLTLDVDIDLGRALKTIASPSHAISTQFGENRYHVTFAGGISEMDRDVVLNLSLAKEPQPAVQVADGPDGAKYLAVTFIPEFEESDLIDRPAADVTFVLDCSGSMQGESIVQAKAALELCLRSLNLGDRFNLCRFGSTHELMSPEPLVYADATLKQALAYVAGIDADLGGTELHAPLKAVLSQRAAGVRQIILLTDGQISNEDAVMKLVRQHRATNRVFSFGIGSAPSATLVRGLARASGGAAEFIAAGENIADKVLRTFSRIGSPALTEVEVDFGSAEATIAGEVPPVFDGDVVTVFARVTGRVPDSITLKARSAAGPKSWEARSAQGAADTAIAPMWARGVIRGLEEAPKVNRERLIGLSQAFNVVCSLTAFVAIEHRSAEQRNDGKPELRRIPVMLARGWHGIRNRAGAAAAGAPVVMSAPCAMPSQTIDKCMDASMMSGSIRRVMADRTPKKIAELREQSFASPLQQLLSFQSAEGWFETLRDTKLRLDPPAGIMDKVAKAEQAHVAATYSVLVRLRRDFGKDEAIWRAAYEKAVRYLAKVTGMAAKELKTLLGAVPVT